VKTTYLNVDLEIASRRALAPLTDELRAAMFELHRERGLACYETNDQRAKTPSAAIRAIVRVLDRLSPAAKRCWRAAHRRDFDVGIGGGATPFQFAVALDEDVVREVARLGGRIVITVYGKAR
jgi:hypothetical protein